MAGVVVNVNDLPKSSGEKLLIDWSSVVPGGITCQDVERGVIPHEPDTAIAHEDVDAVGVCRVQRNIRAVVVANTGGTAIARRIRPASFLIDLISDGGHRKRSLITAVADIGRGVHCMKADEPTVSRTGIPVNLGSVERGEKVALFADSHGITGTVFDGRQFDTNIAGN